MSDEPLTHDELHAQVRDALIADPRAPRGVRLGQKQMDAIVAYQRSTAGSEDIGPLTEFAGVPVLESGSADELVLDYEEEATTTEPQPEEPSPSAN